MKQFTLLEHSETIQHLWQRHTKAHYKQDDIYMTDELPLKPILTFLVKEGVALDRDKAK